MIVAIRVEHSMRFQALIIEPLSDRGSQKLDVSLGITRDSSNACVSTLQAEASVAQRLQGVLGLVRMRRVPHGSAGDSRRRI